jgi:hypothetical protein
MGKRRKASNRMNPKLLSQNWISSKLKRKRMQEQTKLNKTIHAKEINMEGALGKLELNIIKKIYQSN